MVLTCAIEAGAQQVCQAQEPADRDLRRRRHGDARRLRRRHPHRDLHAVPGGRHDRDQPGPPPRSLGHLQGQAAQGMERVVDRDRREEGIMPAVAWCAISTSIRCGPARWPPSRRSLAIPGRGTARCSEPFPAPGKPRGPSSNNSAPPCVAPVKPIRRLWRPGALRGGAPSCRAAVSFAVWVGGRPWPASAAAGKPMSGTSASWARLRSSKRFSETSHLRPLNDGQRCRWRLSSSGCVPASGWIRRACRAVGGNQPFPGRGRGSPTCASRSWAIRDAPSRPSSASARSPSTPRRGGGSPSGRRGTPSSVGYRPIMPRPR